MSEVLHLDDAIINFGDRLAGGIDRLGDALFGAPKFQRALGCRNCRWFTAGAAVVCEHKEFGNFRVEVAERIVAARPRALTVLGPDRLRLYVSRRDVNVRHLAHVRPERPGILGLARADGRLRRFIVEGHHRSYNALVARSTFVFYQLTERETAACLTD